MKNVYSFDNRRYLFFSELLHVSVNDFNYFKRLWSVNFFRSGRITEKQCYDVPGGGGVANALGTTILRTSKSPSEIIINTIKLGGGDNFILVSGAKL